MQSIPLFIIIINSILLVIVFTVGAIMLRAASKYTWAVGDSEKREQLKWVILKTIVTLISIGLFAAIFNLLF